MQIRCSGLLLVRISLNKTSLTQTGLPYRCLADAAVQNPLPV